MGPSVGPKVARAVPEVRTRAGIARPVAVAGLVVAAAAAVVLGYAVGRGGGDESAGESAPSAPEGAQAAPRAPIGEDAHWFQPDDYLVSKRPYDGGKLTRLRVAKPLGAPPRAGERATFLDASSNQVETTYYWRTRAARPQDLAVGALAFCMARSSEKTAAAPEDKQRARVGEWILASVTEIADVDRGTVSVGGVACAVSGVRVVAAPAAQ